MVVVPCWGLFLRILGTGLREGVTDSGLIALASTGCMARLSSLTLSCELDCLDDDGELFLDLCDGGLILRVSLVLAMCRITGSLVCRVEGASAGLYTDHTCFSRVWFAA